jgi:hopanoid biosynthesis associated protein HpnK
MIRSGGESAARGRPGAAGPLRLVVTADDFGRSHAVNAAVARAHREGILTSASLMVTGAAADEAVSLARVLPRLAVGLHLALVDARPALPPSEIPHLVGADGLLERDPARAGLRWATSAAARRELEREIVAQFERFATTGLPLSHVDGHHHLHVHPAVFPLVADLAARHGARGVRLPAEGLRALPDALPRSAAAEAVALGLLARGWRGAARRRGLASPRAVHGIVRSGTMDATYLLDLVRRLRAPSAEIFVHPSTVAGEPRGPNPGDLSAVTSPAVRAAIAARGIALATYADLEAR